MSHLRLVTPNRQYIRSDLEEAYLDFILSRQAQLCAKGTIRFYSFTAGQFVEWLISQAISTTRAITTRLIRTYLAGYANRGCTDSYIHSHARAIKTFVRFLHSENYISKEITFLRNYLEESTSFLATSHGGTVNALLYF
jgi:site-specific recombinase XerD